MKSKLAIRLIFLAALPNALSCSHSILIKQDLREAKINSTSVQGDSLTFSKEEIAAEMSFTTADKIGSVVGGAAVGYGLGIISGLMVGGAIEKTREDEGWALVPYALAGGKIGAVLGGIFFYKINRHIAREEAIARLSEKKRKRKN